MIVRARSGASTSRFVGAAFGRAQASSAAEPPAAQARGETPRTPQRLRRAAIGLCCLGLLAASCSDDTEAPAAEAASPAAVLASLADGVIVPSYEALVDGFDSLDASLETLCGTPSTPALEAARGAWVEVSLAWRRTRAGGVGPAMDRRLMGAVGFLARPASVDALLASGDPVDPAALAEEGAAVRGISAIEVALFADGADVLARPDGGGRCEYARSATQLSGEATADVLADWTGGYRDTFVEGMDGTEQSSVDAVVNEVVFRLQEIDDQGLRALVEAGSVEDLPANRHDGPAGTRLAELRALLDGVTAILEGPDGGDGGDGVLSLVEDRSADTAARLRDALAAAQSAIAPLPDAAADAFADLPAVTAAAEAAAALKVLLGTEVASELGVTIGFSDADGDA